MTIPVPRLEYEDDEYYYYVKAVPKACVTTSERSIKKINGSSAKDERPAQDNVVSYANPIFHGDEKAVTTDEAAAPVERKKDIDSVDFEKKLEESLKICKKQFPVTMRHTSKIPLPQAIWNDFGYVT